MTPIRRIHRIKDKIIIKLIEGYESNEYISLTKITQGVKLTNGGGVISKYLKELVDSKAINMKRLIPKRVKKEGANHRKYYKLNITTYEEITILKRIYGVD